MLDKFFSKVISGNRLGGIARNSRAIVKSYFIQTLSTRWLVVVNEDYLFFLIFNN